MNVSVGICTWNRAKLLKQTLEGMTKLNIPPGLKWELLIVNNGSSDNTETVLKAYEEVLPLRWWHESRPGKSNAANSIIQQLRGDLILWTDDDVIVNSHWLAEYVRAAEAYPAAQFFGGVVEPWFESNPPHWVRKNHSQLLHVFALTQDDCRRRDLGLTELPIGANMAVRAGVQKDFLFNTEISNVGDKPIGGEENDLIRRLRAAGYQGMWVGTARVRHFVPNSRMTVAYVRRWAEGRGRADARLGTFDEFKCFGGVPHWVWRKWLEAKAVECLTWPFGGTNWLQMMKRAARYGGIIKELSQRAKSPTAAAHYASQAIDS